MHCVKVSRNGPDIIRGGDGDDEILGLDGIDQLFGECSDDAVATGVDLTDLILVLARGFDNTASTCIDDGRDPAGLCIKRILLCHFLASR